MGITDADIEQGLQEIVAFLKEQGVEQVVVNPEWSRGSNPVIYFDGGDGEGERVVTLVRDFAWSRLHAVDELSCRWGYLSVPKEYSKWSPSLLPVRLRRRG